jgi:hypothetical protein
MNEEEWLTGGDPSPMLRYLMELGTSERKLRLLACACCRQVWPLLTDPRSRRAVEVAERFADGRATELELGQALPQAMAATGRTQHAAVAAYWAATRKPSGPLENAFAAAAAAAARHAVEDAGGGQAVVWNATQADASRNQAALIREVIGNPFRPAGLGPGWLTWAGGLVPQLAEGVYEDRAFDRMPVLGDALEEAGCTDEAVLGHCRQPPGGHVRGCWVLDLLLQKK